MDETLYLLEIDLCELNSELLDWVEQLEDDEDYETYKKDLKKAQRLVSGVIKKLNPLVESEHDSH